MEKIRFACDYSEGAAPEILSRLMETNLEQTPGYGEDVYCEAEMCIRDSVKGEAHQRDSVLYAAVVYTDRRGWLDERDE